MSVVHNGSVFGGETRGRAHRDGVGSFRVVSKVDMVKGPGEALWAHQRGGPPQGGLDGVGQGGLGRA